MNDLLKELKKLKGLKGSIFEHFELFKPGTNFLAMYLHLINLYILSNKWMNIIRNPETTFFE